jgi:transcriptional regulator with XRE-family HTH domain
MQLVANALQTKLRQAMYDQGLSVKSTADRCGVAYGSLTNILYGRTHRPEPETVEALATGLGLTYRELALAAYGIITDSALTPSMA